MSQKEIVRFQLDKKELKVPKKTRIILISDSHVSTHNEIFNEQMFLKGIQEINKIKNIDHVIHLGDLTHDGTMSDYLRYLTLMEKLRPGLRDKLHTIPGNHDSKNVGYRLYEEMVSEERNFLIELSNEAVIFGVDSTEPDQDEGEIGFRTTSLFKKLISQYPGFVLFCFHHQLVPIPKTGRERSAITDAGNVLKMLLDSNVNLVLNGHRHITNLYSMTDGDGELVVFNAGTFSCNKTRYRQLWTYTILDIDDELIKFTIRLIRDARDFDIISRPTIAGTKPPRIKPGAKVAAKIIHMANSNFSARNTYDETAWKLAVKKINEMDCNLVVHTGNLVANTYNEDYQMAKAMMSDFIHPTLIIPGHNETEYPMSWRFFEKYIGSTDPFYDKDNILFFGLNSCQTGIKKGVIGRRVLMDVLNRGMGELPRKIVGVGLFHEIIPSPMQRWTAPLLDAGDVLNLFAQSGIDLILSGSSYSNWTVQVENAIFSSCGAVADKKAFYYKEIGNSFNIITVYENGIIKIEEHQIQNKKTREKRVFKIPVFANC